MHMHANGPPSARPGGEGRLAWACSLPGACASVLRSQHASVADPRIFYLHQQPFAPVEAAPRLQRGQGRGDARSGGRFKLLHRYKRPAPDHAVNRLVSRLSQQRFIQINMALLGRHMALSLAFALGALLQAAEAGSYLGCFDVDAFRLSLRSHKPAGWKLADCEARCITAQFPLHGLAHQNTQCLCGSYIPNGLHQLTDQNCLAKTVPSLALYYTHYGGQMLVPPA